MKKLIITLFTTFALFGCENTTRSLLSMGPAQKTVQNCSFNQIPGTNLRLTPEALTAVQSYFNADNTWIDNYQQQNQLYASIQYQPFKVFSHGHKRLNGSTYAKFTREKIEVGKEVFTATTSVTSAIITRDCKLYYFDRLPRSMNELTRIVAKDSGEELTTQDFISIYGKDYLEQTNIKTIASKDEYANQVTFKTEEFNGALIRGANDYKTNKNVYNGFYPVFTDGLIKH